MNLDLFIERLKAAAPLLEGRVQGSANLAPAEAGTGIKTPCAFIVPVQEKVPDSRVDWGGDEQIIVVEFGVVSVVRNVADINGQAGHRLLEDVRTEQWRALTGFQGGGLGSRVAFVRGNLIDYRNNSLRWLDIYTSSFLRSK